MISRTITKAFIPLFLFIFMAGVLGQLQAQTTDGNFDELQDDLKNEYFSVGALLQVVGDYQVTPGASNNGYSISNARFQVYGEIDQQFGYQLQANMIKSPALLDANVYYNLTPDFTVKAGLFKTPFSGEYLTGAANIDFVNRATVVNQLATNRQIGVQLGGKLADGNLRYKAGIFNGNGLGSNQNSDEHFQYVGRLESHLSTGENADDKLVIGVNGAYEQKDNAASSGSLRSTFAGEQVLFGTDARLMQNNFSLSGEFIYSWMTSEFGFEYNPYGYQATAGYFVSPKTQLLVRYDRFAADNLIPNGGSESVLAGLNYFPSSFSEIQLNYIVPTEPGFDESQVLLNLQINF